MVRKVRECNNLLIIYLQRLGKWVGDERHGCGGRKMGEIFTPSLPIQRVQEEIPNDCFWGEVSKRRTATSKAH